MFSSARCIIEQVNGILKNRFSSLKGIRTQVKKKEDFKKVNDHIIITIILHNMLNTWKDEWDDKDPPEDDDSIAVAAVASLSVSQSADQLRIRVQNYLLSWFYAKEDN